MRPAKPQTKRRDELPALAKCRRGAALSISACRKRRVAVRAARAPRFIWCERCGQRLDMTRAPPLSPIATVSSVLPPSTRMSSAGTPPAWIESIVVRSVSASLSAGITTEISAADFIQSVVLGPAPRCEKRRPRLIARDDRGILHLQANRLFRLS